MDVETKDDTDIILKEAITEGINLRRLDDYSVGISLDETTTADDVMRLCKIFGVELVTSEASIAIPKELIRKSEYLRHPIFNSLHSETELMRYIRKLSDKDIALDRAICLLYTSPSPRD